MTQLLDSERKTLILTGASRGIGHATVKRFSTAGWRVDEDKIVSVTNAEHSCRIGQ